MGRLLRHLLLLVAGLAGLTALLAPPLRAADTSTRYVVGVEELNYYPVYAVQDGQYVGAARELLDAFAADAGFAFDYRPLPINRLYAELMGGTIDFKFPDNAYWNATAKEGAGVTYSDPVIAYIDGVMVRPERVGQGPDAFSSLGTVTGFTPFSWLERIQAGQVKVSENAQMRALLRQVLADRIDGAYVSIAVATHMLGTELKDAGTLQFDPALPHSRDHYLLSSTQHPEVIARFNAWLAENADRVAEIKARWGAEAGVN